MDYNYSDSDDSSIYIENILKLGEHKLMIKAVTVAGDEEKPNEDAFAVRVQGDSIWIAVIDGASSLKPIFSIEQSGARFSSHFLRKKFYELELKTPKSMLIELNNSMLEESKKIGGSLKDTHSLPSSMGTIVHLDFSVNKLELAHVGDTYCIVYKEDGFSQSITEDRNKKFDDRMFSLIEEIAAERSVTNREAREDDRVNKALVDMYIQRNNSPKGTGSGMINGDPNLEKYIQSEEFDISAVNAVLVASDGLEIQGHSLGDPGYRNELNKIIKESGFKELIRAKRESEDKDPDWNNVRYKHAADATGVYVERVSD